MDFDESRDSSCKLPVAVKNWTVGMRCWVPTGTECTGPTAMHTHRVLKAQLCVPVAAYRHETENPQVAQEGFILNAEYISLPPFPTHCLNAKPVLHLATVLEMCHVELK